ncbi:hypothetical protein Hypma_008552 [Hypsizygus marmoreus]|uniref:Uncharacterized protein n=1 Tax=Hypsizygus marmoreus TaxID=39966 RepID=A0A369JUR6_HYPMA|nr:hypothetical protein Hypma_008552 [Hypsizygus marmoreus]
MKSSILSLVPILIRATATTKAHEQIFDAHHTRNPFAARLLVDFLAIRDSGYHDQSTHLDLESDRQHARRSSLFADMTVRDLVEELTHRSRCYLGGSVAETLERRGGTESGIKKQKYTCTYCGRTFSSLQAARECKYCAEEAKKKAVKEEALNGLKEMKWCN